MKLLIVPLWLSNVLKDNALSKPALLNAETLAPFLSKNDLRAYKAINSYGYVYGINFLIKAAESLNKPDMPSFDYLSTSKVDKTELEKQHISGSAKKYDEELLIGFPLTEGFYLSFTVDLVDGDIIMLSAVVQKGQFTERSDAREKVYSEVLELLYASNSIGVVANTSLMREYIQHNI